MGACCPHTPCPESKDASRREYICWGRNRLLLSPCRGFRPQLPPLPWRGMPKSSGIRSLLAKRRGDRWIGFFEGVVLHAAGNSIGACSSVAPDGGKDKAQGRSGHFFTGAQ